MFGEERVPKGWEAFLSPFHSQPLFKATMSDITHIGELIPDARNARLHNPRNIGMIVDSLHEVGAARSIVIDEEGNILAGNGTIEAAAEAGIEKVLTVDADGETIVAVRRTGLSKKQKKRLALFDNRTAEIAGWDPAILAELATEDLTVGLFVQDEIDAILASVGDADWEGSIGALPEGDRAPFQQMTFTLSDEQAESVKAALEAAKDKGPFVDAGNENSNGNALARICESYVS